MTFVLYTVQDGRKGTLVLFGFSGGWRKCGHLEDQGIYAGRSEEV